MKTLLRFWLVSVLTLCAGCQLLLGVEVPLSPDDELIWVSTTYTGGKQCESSPPFNPPDTWSLFDEAGITVFDTDVERLATCMACGCPSDKEKHKVLIEREQLDEARKIGFRP